MRRCAHFYRLFASASIDLSFLRVQIASANTAPFINDHCAGLAADTKNVLADIQLGLKTEGADYPVLRVFASWPGKAKLERIIKQKTQGKKKQGKKKKLSGQEPDVDDIDDPDQHPLAVLHLENFINISKGFDRDWLKGEVEEKIVVQSRKHALEEQDSEHSVLRK